MPLITNLSRDIATEFVATIDPYYVKAGRCGHSSTQLAGCNVLVVKMALTIAELLKPPGQSVRYVISNKSGVIPTFDEGMLTGWYDVIPTPVALSDLLEDAEYFHQLPQYSIEYGIYGNANSRSEKAPPSSLHFLFAPFPSAVWLVIGVSLIISIGLEYMMRQVPVGSIGTKITFLALSSMALIEVYYNTELKTLAYVPENLFDLADDIRGGRRVILLEDNTTIRWDILADKQQYRPESLQAVFEAIRVRGLGTALIYEPNMTKICHLLQSSSIHVFFGNEERFVGICQIDRLMKYLSVDYPLYRFIAVAKTNPAAKYADTLLHAYDSLRSRILTRLVGRIQTPERTTDAAPMIGTECIGAGGIVFGVGTMMALIVFGVELLWKRITEGNSRMQYEVNQGIQ